MKKFCENCDLEHDSWATACWKCGKELDEPVTNEGVTNSEIKPCQPDMYVSNGIGVLLNVLGYAVLILGGLGSLMLGSGLGGYGFNWTVFITGMLSVLVGSGIILGLGQIVEKLSRIEYEMDKQNKFLNQITTNKSITKSRCIEKDKASTNISTEIPTVEEKIITLDKNGKEYDLFGEDWKCTQCTKMNPSTTMYCIECGRKR